MGRFEKRNPLGGDVTTRSPVLAAAGAPSKVWGYLAISLTIATATSWTIAAGARQFVVSYWPDDALFYNVVARNIVHGLGSTCDGIAPTNGYHPLWMGVHVVLAWAFGDVIVPEVVLQGLLLLIALFLLYDYVAALTTRSVALGLCLIAASEQTYLRVLSSGMETHLAFIALLLILRLAQRWSWQPMGPRQRVALSAAMALLFFSRLDGGLMWIGFSVLVMTGWLGRTEPIGRRAKLLVQVLAVPLVFSLAYLLANQLQYGIAMPVSGRIKSVTLSQLVTAGHLRNGLTRLAILFGIDTFGSIRAAFAGAATSAVDRYVSWFILAPLVLLGMILCLRRHPHDASLRILSLYGALHAIYYTMLQTESYSLSWARGPELLMMSVACAFMLSELLNRLARRYQVRVPAVPVLVLLMLVSMSYDGWKALRLDVVRDFEVRSADFWSAVEYVRSHVPPDSVIASNNIGFIGYFSERSVFSVDGLLNSTEYYRAYLRRNRETEYMRIHGVRYSINAMPRNIDPIDYLCRYYPGLKRDNVRVLAQFAGDTDGPLLRNYALFELSL